jgi:hypothetical protein
MGVLKRQIIACRTVRNFDEQELKASCDAIVLLNVERPARDFKEELFLRRKTTELKRSFTIWDKRIAHYYSRWERKTGATIVGRNTSFPHAAFPIKALPIPQP